MSLDISAFEQASRDAQVPALRVAAEETLASFSRHPSSSSFYLQVILNTNTPVARYHAASFLRANPSLPPALLTGPSAARVLLLNLAASHHVLPYERSAVLAAAASLAHAAYISEDPASRTELVATIADAARDNSADTRHIVTALEMLTMLVAVFTPKAASKAAPAAASVRHEASAALFGAADSELGLAFGAACGALDMIMANARDRPRVEVHAIARHALILIADVMMFGCKADEVVYSHVFGAEWRGILSGLPALVGVVFQLFDGFRNRGEDDGDGEVVRAVVDVLEAVTVVYQGSYGPGEADAFLHTLLHALEGRPWSATSAAQERLMYAAIWRRISVAHGLRNVHRVEAGALESFRQHTVEILGVGRASAAADEAEEDWSRECDCLLLEAWAELARQAEEAGDSTFLQQHVSSVVGEFVDQSVRQIEEFEEEEDFGFEDESHEAAQIEAAALLCRYASDICLPQLACILGELSQRAFARREGSSLSALRQGQEDLVWTLRLTGAVLADDVESETPQVPRAFRRGGEGCRALFGALFALAQLESSTLEYRSRHGVDGDDISPRVEAEILIAFRRVAKTYLLPATDDEERIALLCVGGTEAASSARTLALSRSVFSICNRAHEGDLVSAAAEVLSTLAPGRSSGRYPEMCVDAAWSPLPKLGLEHFEALPPRATTFLGSSLAHYFADKVVPCLVQPAVQSLSELGGQQSSIADASERCQVAIYLLCGVARCSQAVASVHEHVLASIRGPSGGVLVATREFTRSNVSVSIAAVKFAQDIVLCHMPLLGSEDSVQACFADCLTLLCEALAVVSSNVQEISQDDVTRLVVAGLELLQSLVDAHVGLEVGKASRSTSVFGCLNCVLPLLSDSIFAAPDVKNLFLALVTELTTSSPESLPGLPVAFVEKILEVLSNCAFGRFEEKVMRGGLEAISSLASFRVRQPNLGNAQNPSVAALDLRLEGFLCAILEGILMGGANFRSSLDAAAEALLPLMLCGEKAGARVAHACRTLASQAGGGEQVAVAKFESMKNASKTAAQVLGHFPGGDVAAAGNADRRQAKLLFSSAVHELSHVALNGAAVSAT